MDALNDVLQSKSPIVKIKKDLQEGGKLYTLGLHPTEHLIDRGTKSTRKVR